MYAGDCNHPFGGRGEGQPGLAGRCVKEEAAVVERLPVGHPGALFVSGGTVRWQAAGRTPMDNPASILEQGRSEEHVAPLVVPRRFGLLRRWDDLFDEGVAAVFGMAGGEAELVGLCFHGGKFTPAESATW